MNKKLITSAACAIMLALLAGCVGPGPIEEVDIHVGTYGLIMNFLDRAPPSEAYEGSTFKMVMTLTNLGVDDIESGIIAFGFERPYLSLEGEPFEQIIVEGKESNAAGGKELIERTVSIGKLDPQVETLTTTLTATACYPYKTTASPLVCIDTDIYNLKEQEKSCIPEKVSMAGGQGGPIAVISVTPKMIPSKENPDITIPQFEIRLENAGEGQSINPFKFVDACQGKPLTTEDWNTVNVNARIITGVGSEYLNCKPKRKGEVGSTGYLKIKEGTEFVRCVYEKGVHKSMGTYTTPLIIELEYGYVQSISRSILIRKELR